MVVRRRMIDTLKLFNKLEVLGVLEVVMLPLSLSWEGCLSDTPNLLYFVHLDGVSFENHLSSRIMIIIIISDSSRRI